jgi:hypothetical protein
MISILKEFDLHIKDELEIEYQDCCLKYIINDLKPFCNICRGKQTYEPNNSFNCIISMNQIAYLEK